VALVAVAGSFELGTNVGVVKYFAVVGDPDCVVLVGHGLAASGEVDDAEAAVAEGDFSTNIMAGAVRAAVGDDIGHPADEALVGWGAVGVQKSGDATHALVQPYGGGLKSGICWSQRFNSRLGFGRTIDGALFLCHEA